MTRDKDETCGNRRKGQGFTLLEVLGAVAVLGIWYFVLAAWATDGLIREGQSLRKMRAGLIADRALAELEAISLGGAVPELMDEVVEPEDLDDELYLIRKQITPFTLDYGSGKTSEEQENDLAQSFNEDLPPLPSLLGQNIPGFARHLYQINVIVSWTEGFMNEQAVYRTTYVFDMTSAAEAYQSEDMKRTEEDDEEEDDGLDEDEFLSNENDVGFEEDQE